MTIMSRASLAGSFTLVATLAVAQPRPHSQPPQPQNPTPVPAPKPHVFEKPQPEPPTPAPAGRLGTSELTLAGCLQLAAESKPDSSVPGSPIAAGYVLRGALPVSKDGKRETTGSLGKEYRIIASNESVKLFDLVGHQVRVTGRVTVQSESPGQAATEAGRSTSHPSGSTGVSAAAPTGSPALLVTLSVSSVESMSPACTTPSS